MSPYKETVIGSFGSGTFIGEVPILLAAPYERVTVRTLEQSHLFRKKGDLLADDIYLSISNTGDLAYYGATFRIGINCIVRAGETYFSWNLAAGLAHELNNPATAAGRVTTQLHQIFQTLPSLSIKVYQRKDMTPEQLAYVSNLEYDLTRDYTSKNLLLL